MDEAVKVLQANKDVWVALGLHERIRILDEIKLDLMSGADRWVAASLAAKGIPARTFGEGEEWATLAAVFRAVRLLRQSLIDIRNDGRPQLPKPLTTRPDGQVVAQVFPQTITERLLFRGITGEVWMRPGITVEETITMQARSYQDNSRNGQVVLVLGAGNVSALPVTDVLSKLFVEHRVVILKTNPINAYLAPLIEDGLRALISRGFLRLIQGGAAEGSYLCQHPAVDEIHLTGSDKTFEAILFGPGPEGAAHKAERTPVLIKRVTAELGNISPVVIVPGPWNNDDVIEQAVQLATMLAANAGCNCNTPRVIVQHRSWAQRNALLRALGDVLSGVKTRRAYYPGAKERHAAFVAAHPEARHFGEASHEDLPWTLIADVDPTRSEDICFKTEAFCSLLAETALEAASVPAFLDRAVEFVNETLWGTLTATLIVHPKSLEDLQVGSAVERAITNLRYGTIGINLFVAYGYYFMLTPWGGYPGHDLYNVQSGIGWTNNALMFEAAQKSVYRAPFTKIDPLTVTSRRTHEFGKKLASFEAAPSLWKLPGLLWTALRS